MGLHNSFNHTQPKNNADVTVQIEHSARLEEIKKLTIEDLARSGLTPEEVYGLEYTRDVPLIKGTDKPEAIGGYTFPYLWLDNSPILDNDREFRRLRLVGPLHKEARRYHSSYGSSNHVYIPHGLIVLLARINQQREIMQAVDVLYITEGEKKAIRAVKAGIPTLALPGVTMWSDNLKVKAQKQTYAALGGDPRDIRMTEDTPVNLELLEAITQIKALCPSIGVICILYDAGGKPIRYEEAYQKTKKGLVAVGGVDWKGCDVPYAEYESFVSENPNVTHAGFTLAAALRKQMTVRAVVATRFCNWDTKKDPEKWKEQGLDDLLQAEEYPFQVHKQLRNDLATAMRLWKLVEHEPLFTCSADPDELGADGGPSAEEAFSRMLDVNNVGRADGLLYQWIGSHWQLIDKLRAEEAAHSLQSAFYRDVASARKTADAPKLAVSESGLYRIPKPRRWKEVGGAIIPCSDKTLDISPKGEITVREPSKEDGLRYCIDANWTDKDNPSPEFDNFIIEVLPDADVRRLVQQYVGYTLISDTRFQVAQWWFGSGANGKGFLAKIVAALHRKVAAADIENLGGFGAENLIDASLVTVDETPKRIDEQRLKSAISGDDITINRKYMTSVTVRFMAKWLLRGNEKPALSDQTDGIWRRLHIIEFTEKFEGNRRDDMLAERIVENELSGVMRWAVEGLVQLLTMGGFKDIPESVQAAKREMQVETDNVLGWWVAKEVRLCNAPRTAKEVTYRNYSMWCKDNGMMPLGAPRFWTRVRSIVERDYGTLVETRTQETLTDPTTGTVEIVRTRKVNLDMDGTHDDVASNNVVLLKPKAEPKPQSEAAPPEQSKPLVPTIALGDSCMQELAETLDAPYVEPEPFNYGIEGDGYVDIDE